LTIISREDQTTDGAVVNKQILRGAKLKTRKRGQNRAEWEKSIKGAKVRIGL